MLRKFCIASIAFATAAQCLAATVDPVVLSRLKTEAVKNGAASVLVHLQSVSLDALRKTPREVAASVGKKADALLAELGQHAWPVGRLSNSAGQISIYVDSDGLNILAASGLAQAFFVGENWRSRSGLSDGGDAAFDEIDRRLQSDNFVDLVVVPNVLGIAQTVTKANEVRFSANAGAVLAARDLANRLRLTVGTKQAPASGTADAAPNQNDAKFSLRVDRLGLLRLLESGAALGFKPAGHRDARETYFDPQLDEDLKRFGQTRVLISVRTFFGGSKMPPSASAGAALANLGSLREILGDIYSRPSTAQLAQYGMAGVTLNASELLKLQRANDARLLSVISAVPNAVPRLTNVNAILNTDQVRQLGYIATGQNIVLLDTGVEKNHPFLTQGGASKVVYEACFGTNLSFTTESFTSVCPGQNASGDSIPGTAGSGEALATCAPSDPASCGHGTHMAGILVGKSSTINGLAQGASLSSVQVFSKYQNGPTGLFFSSAEDMASALQYLNSLLAPGTLAAPYTVVAGSGTEAYQSQSTCESAFSNISSIVLTLKNAGVAVIAPSIAIGNGIGSGILPQQFPACVSNVVKVGGTLNSGTGNLIASSTTLFEPIRFPDGQFFLAPGYDVTSSVLNGAYQSQGGSSQSAAAIAALYAVYKAAVPTATVSDITSYLVANAIPVTITYECGTPSVTRLCTTTFPRVRVPNL